MFQTSSTYTVIWVCMLGSISVEGDTDLYKLSEFNYREFNHLMVKKVTQVIEKSKIDFEWKSGSAALTYKGMSKANAIPIEVQDEEGWKKSKNWWRKLCVTYVALMLTMPIRSFHLSMKSSVVDESTL